MRGFVFSQGRFNFLYPCDSLLSFQIYGGILLPPDRAAALCMAFYMCSYDTNKTGLSVHLVFKDYFTDSLV